jgi:hypothetical protein
MHTEALHPLPRGILLPNKRPAAMSDNAEPSLRAR